MSHSWKPLSIICVFFFAGMLSAAWLIPGTQSAQESETQSGLQSAQWQFSEARVNSFQSSTQSNAALAVAPDGTSVVAWDSRRQQRGTYGVYLQRFAADGSRVGVETQINLYDQSMQMKPAVAVDATGATWAAWESFGQDGSMNAIIGRRFDAESFSGGDEFAVNETASGQQANVVVAADANGVATFAWTTPATETTPQRILFRQFNAAGEPLCGETSVYESSNAQNLPTIDVDSSGNVAIAWAETSITNNHPAGIYARVINNDKDFVSDPIVVADAGTDVYSIEPSISTCENRQFAVAWLNTDIENGNGEYTAVYSRFHFSGECILPATVVSPETARRISGVAVDSDKSGKLFVAWNRNAVENDPEQTLLEGRQFQNDGKPVGDIFQINQHDAKSHQLSIASGKQRIAINEAGLVLAAWNGASDSDSSAVCLTIGTTRPNEHDVTIALSAPPAQDDDVFADSGNETARPHDPPTFNPKNIAIDRFGGDPNPQPRGTSFGFIGIVNSGWTPPDPTLAVGPNHIAATTNGAIAFFDKDGTKTFEDEIENNFGFWGNEGATNFVFDPEVVYDVHSNRFFAMACERSNDNRSFFLVAVSDDDDPNGNWNKYRLDVTALAGNDIDSANLAIDETAVYLTADFFSPSNYLMLMVDKADMMAGVSNPGSTNLLNIGTHSFGIATNTDANSPATYMINGEEFVTSTQLTLHAIENPLTNPTQTSINITVPVYGHPNDPAQMGTSIRPELFESRFWSCVYRNGSLWAVHHQSPDSTTPAQDRWYEFAMNNWPASGNTPTLVQSGSINPGANVYTFFPSIWVDDEGNAAITFAKSSSSEFISMCSAIRKASDPPGTFRPFTVEREGSAPTGSRWGDYSGTMQDPGDPRVFWGIHEYLLANGSWNTWIAQYIIPTSFTDIAPDSFVKNRGLQVGGSFADITTSDNSYLSFKQQLVRSPSAPRIQITVDGTSAVANPASLSINVESKANHPDVNQTIEVYNFDTDQFDLVDAQFTPMPESVITVELTGDVSRFVEPGTGLMQARIGWKRVGLIRLAPVVDIDHIFWTVGE